METREASLDLKEAARFLGLTLPVTKNQLKRAYHRRSMEEHPDKSKAKDAKERFTRLIGCYEMLQEVAAVAGEWVEEFAAELLCTDGTPVKICGSGLGPTTNGTPCGDCSGRGFTAFSAESCPDCRPNYGGLDTIRLWDDLTQGAWQYRCWICKGLGEIKTVNGARECSNCASSGFANGAKRGNHCTTCKGTHLNVNGRKVYNRCMRCKGCGELPMWNPVLPRGLLL